MRWISVWRRHVIVSRKIILAAFFSSVGEPLIYLLALGYGLGQFVHELDGVPYVLFLASGIVVSGAMNTASFEAMYSGYTRMHMQHTWTAMITAPLAVRDVFLGELMWIGTKCAMSAIAMILVGGALGIFTHWQGIFVLPMIFLTACCFGAMGLVMTSIAQGYGFFMYYFTLFLTPMMMLSGVFFPLSGMPDTIQTIAKCLPLYHALAVTRPILLGEPVTQLGLHILVLLVFTIAASLLAMTTIEKRLCN